MSTQPPPRYVVHTVDDPAVRRRRRLWWVLGWIVSLVVVGVGVYLATDTGPLASVEHTDSRELKKENDTLHQQVATLTRSLQVSQVATRSLTDSLAESEEKINGLRADLAFYSHLIGGGSQHHGLRIQTVTLARVGESHAWNFTVTLTHNVKRGSEVKGDVKVTVEGIRDGKLVRLAWKDLAGKDDQGGIDFGFRYFQQVRGTLMLPADFTPNRLRVEASPAGGKTVVETLDWGDALISAEKEHVQQQQPTKEH